MPIAKRDLQQCLQQKFGFEKVPGSRHDALSLIVNGRKVATTRFSRSTNDISDKILGMIARQIWVQQGYLRRMYGCTKSLEDYLQHLRDTDHLP